MQLNRYRHPTAHHLCPTNRQRRLRILTWHVHGNYLYYLTQVPHDFYLVTSPRIRPATRARSACCRGATTCTRSLPIRSRRRNST